MTDVNGSLQEQAKKMFEPICEQPCRQYVLLAMLWLLWCVVFSMNYIAYFHDHSRYSDEVFIMGMSNKTFSLITGLITVLLNVIILWGLIGNTPLLEKIPHTVRIIIVAVISALSVGVIIYTHIIASPVELQNKEPVLSSKYHRIILYSLILIINLIIVFMKFSFDRNNMSFEFSENGGLIDGIEQFGGCERVGMSPGNVFGFIFGLIGVVANVLTLKRQITYGV